MKNLFTISGLILASAISLNAHAARTPNQQAALEGATFTGLTIAGTVAAGPIGFLVGALSGAFLADQSRQANQNELALQRATEDQVKLQALLQDERARAGELEELATATMTFQILFASGDDTLSELDLQRVKQLADHLRAHPELRVTLDGHADPRGTDEYNNVLSQERAKAVKEALENSGIESNRITYTGHGNRFSSAAKGDFEAYRQERRVDITVEHPAPAYTGI